MKRTNPLSSGGDRVPQAAGAPESHAPPDRSAAEAFSTQWRRASSKHRLGTAAAARAYADAAQATDVYAREDAGSNGGGGVHSSSKPLKLTDEEKVEKHRMIVRRSYYQKKELKARLRQDIERLERQYSELMARTQPSSLSYDDADDVSVAAMADLLVCSCCESMPCVRALYRELSARKEALRAQNDALEEQILEHLHFHDKVAFIAARQLNEGSNANEKKSSRSHGALIGELGELLMGFKPLTEEECFATIRAVQLDVVSQRTTTRFQDVGPPVLGWNRKRTFGSEAKFSLLKRFEGECAAHLAERTWGAYTDSDLFAQLYSGAVNMRFQLLQRVNSNNVLFYRSLQTDLLTTRRVTFFQLSRVQGDDPSQVFLIFCSLEPTRIQPDVASRDNWLDMFSWFCFSDSTDALGAPVCEIEFGGNVPSSSVADTEFWMMEFLSYLLRYENKFVRPVFDVNL